MEKNQYTGSRLFQEIRGVNLFLSVVDAEWFDCLDFNPFEYGDCDLKKKKKNYYLVGQFGHEKNYIDNNSDIRIIKDLGVKENFEIKNFWVAARKWLKEFSNVENVKIKLLKDVVFENKHFYFFGDNLFLKKDLPNDSDLLAKIFYLKNSFLCDKNLYLYLWGLAEKHNSSLSIVKPK